MKNHFSLKKVYLLYALINIAIPLLLGLSIYLFINRNAYISQLLNISFETNLNGTIGLIIKCWACDMLWIYAFTFALYFALCAFRHKIIIAAIISFCIGVVLEVLQYYRVITGTFDILDILFELAAVLIAVGVIKRRKEI